MMAKKKMDEKRQKSIIKVIREMMQAGESNEKILQTLTEMGVKPEQAKRLISVGQAGTLGVLQQDIGKIAKTKIENEIPALRKMVEDQLMQAKKDLKKSVKDELDEELEVFRGQVNEDIKLVNEVTSSLGEKIGKVDEKADDIRAELKEMQMRRLGTKNEWISLILVLGGLVFNFCALYMFFVTFSAITLDSLILIIVIALTGITMLFGSSII